jgi:iron(III) transport system permease protein
MSTLRLPVLGPAATRARGARVGDASGWILAIGLIVGLLSVLPLAYLIIRAAGADDQALAFLVRPRTIETIVSTVALGALVGVGSVLLGVPVAWLTTRARIPGRRLWSILTVIPLAIPSYVTGFAFIAAFGPRGALQDLLAPLGVQRLPEIYGLPGAALVLILATYPYVVLSVRAGFLAEDRTLVEVGRTLGDDRRSVFRRVTLPLLWPAIGAGALLAVLYAISDFGAVSLLQFDSLSRSIYVQYRAAFDRSLAAILALLLVGLAIALTWGEARIRARARSYTARAPRRPVDPVALGRWSWPAVGFLAAVVGLALGVPIIAIAFWLVRGIEVGDGLNLLGTALGETFWTGAGAAGVAVALALPVGVLVARHPSLLGRLVERSTYVGFALPGVALALALVFLSTSLVPALYQTLALLVAAYGIRFLPQALGGVRTALVRLGRRPEEAARTLGDGPTSAFARVTLPALRPTLLAGAALVFLTTVKELPMALILGPIGFGTLATEIWGAASEGFYSRAAPPAAILLILSAATVAVLIRDERTRA